MEFRRVCYEQEQPYTDVVIAGDLAYNCDMHIEI